MEFCHKNLTVKVLQTKKVADICIVLDFPFTCCWCCLKCLMHNDSMEGVTKNNSLNSALGFSIFETIREKMVGSALETMKLRVSKINCSTNGERFVMSWNTQGTVSNMRRTCTLALSSLNPDKMFSKYMENVKLLGLSSNRDEFEYVADQMIAGLKKEIAIMVIGKINIKEDVLKDTVKTIHSKLKLSAKQGTVVKGIPKSSNDSGHSETPSIPIKGVAGYLVMDYILHKSNGMGADFSGKDVFIYNKSWETKKKQMDSSDKISDYVDKKYGKLDDCLEEMVAYHFASHYVADTDVICKISDGLKLSEIKSMIKEGLK